MKKACLIPVRSGSQRVPNKNFKVFDDITQESLLDIKVKQVLKVFEPSQIIISSDSSKASEISSKLGVNFHLRNPTYANSITNWSDVIQNILSEAIVGEDTTVCWSLCTSPIFSRFGEALESFLSSDNDSLVAVERLQTFLLDKNGKPINFNPGAWHPYSQELQPMFKITGACFIASLKNMMRWKYWYGPNPFLFEVSNAEGVDIDNEPDFEYAQKINRLYQ